MEQNIENIINYGAIIVTIIMVIIRLTPTKKDDLLIQQLPGFIGKGKFWIEKILYIIDKIFTASNQRGVSKDELKSKIAFKLLEESLKLQPENVKATIKEMSNLFFEWSKNGDYEFFYKTEIEVFIDSKIKEFKNEV